LDVDREKKAIPVPDLLPRKTENLPSNIKVNTRKRQSTLGRPWTQPKPKQPPPKKGTSILSSILKHKTKRTEVYLVGARSLRSEEKTNR